MSDIELAIRRIEESKASHVAWAAHLRQCDFCREYPPEHIHTAKEQDQIIAEYDVVLKVLREVANAQSINTWPCKHWRLGGPTRCEECTSS